VRVILRKAASGLIAKPKLYVPAIGVSEYRDKSLTLRYPAKDTWDFASVMAAQEEMLYADVVVKLLVDEQATKDDILDGFDWIQRETTAKDVAVIFIAGHGMNDHK